MYDSKEIEKIVKQKQKMLIAEFAIIIASMIVALILLILNISATLTLISIFTEVLLFFAIYKIFNKQNPKVFFSKEIKGVNVMEDDYVSIKVSGPGLRWRQIGGHAPPQPFAPNTGANTGANRRRAPSNIRCRVYLKLENGNIVTISSLYESHIELFNEGDTLLKYAGTQFPVIISREVKNQPCPICGEVNDMSENSCKVCGLKIINQ